MHPKLMFSIVLAVAGLLLAGCADPAPVDAATAAKQYECRQANMYYTPAPPPGGTGIAHALAVAQSGWQVDREGYRLCVEAGG